MEALIAAGVVELGMVLAKHMVRDWGRLATPKKPPAHVSAAPSGETAQELIAQARATLGIDCAHKYNFGFCGDYGSGKSSLLNALRGVDDNYPSAARVCGTDPTHSVTPYPLPKHDNVVFWELPVAETGETASDYFRSKCVYAYDRLIIVTDGSISGPVLDLASVAAEWRMPVLFVRNKFDVSFADLRVCPGTSGKAAAKQLHQTLAGQVRKVVHQHNPKLVDHNIYVLSAWRYHDQGLVTGDEKLLVKDLLRSKR